MRYVESPSTDPAFNLALEQHLFDTVGRAEDLFMLWRNHNTIVVGRHQNTAEEINAAFVQAHGITVVRRLSGGGAVYHDLGNLNFTFIAAAGAGLDLALFCRRVVKALGELGVAARLSGRNDLTIEGQKFSGNAQYKKDGRVMHHGTLMLDSDLDVLGMALNAPADKIAAHGVKSVRSRVTNLRPYLPAGVTLADFKHALIRSVLGTDTPGRYPLTEADLDAVERLRESRYATREWNWGAAPGHDLGRARRVEGVGRVELRLGVEGGRIARIAAFGDFFGDGVTDALAAALVGCPMEEGALLKALAAADVAGCFHHLTAETLCQIILTGGEL